MLRDEVDEIAARESGLPDAAQNVIRGERLRRLEKDNMVLRLNPDPKTKDVRPTVDFNTDPPKKSNYYFDPGVIDMPLSVIRERYDDATFNAFETWARRTMIPNIEGDRSTARTVWDVFSETGRRTTKRRASAPEPAPETTAITAQGSLVSEAAQLDATMTERNRERAQSALDAIDAVHGDGPLLPIPVTSKIKSRGDGAYAHAVIGERAVTIRFRGNDASELSIAHEVGHWLDHIGIASDTRFASQGAAQPDSDLAAWWQAVQASDALRQIREWTPTRLADIEHRRYLLGAHEIFARSYSQFIAEMSGNKAMNRQIARVLAGETNYKTFQHWTPEDFTPIREALRALFVKLGWMKDI